MLPEAACSVSDEIPSETVSDDDFASELRRRLDAADRIEAGPLAKLFGFGFSPTEKGETVLGVLKNYLARKTLAHARQHTAYYRERDTYDVEIGERPDFGPDLSALPTINRAVVAENFKAFIAEDVRLRSVCHTSGTTGRPLEIYKSYEEIRFIGDFFTTLFASAYQAPERKLSLSFPTPHHGVPIPMPTPAVSFVSGVTDDTLIRDAVRVLSEDYVVDGQDRRISQLQGMAFQVIFFTNYLLEQGIDPSQYKLEFVNVAGGFVPKKWRKFLADSWGCTVNDRFSLTESAGGATRCQKCGAFRPDPQVIFEVLDVDTGAVLDGGIGKLALTNLYPFTQMTPFLRYETGDLVRQRECCSGGPGFDFLGRLHNCIWTGTGDTRRWLLFSSELYEVLATIPDLNIYEWFSNVTAVHDRTVGSLPNVKVRHEIAEDGRIDITLKAELKYSPHTYRERTDELKRIILDHLKGCADSALASALDAGDARFDVNFLPPGGYDDEYVIKI